MLVPLSWLREFAPFAGDARDLAAVFDDLGMVVEGVNRIGEGLDGVVTARVVANRPHPNADKVQLVDVDTGAGESLQVVCGAFNFEPGDVVPLATVGAELPNGMRIERRKVRGEWSNGMLCAPDELGLGDDHSGILVLGRSTAIGIEVREALGLEADVVFDLAIEGNRPDAMSVAGVARDAAARLRLPFAIPEPPPLPVVSGAPAATVSVEAPDLCPRFTATVITAVTVGESPAWLARRLTLAGMRPINAVVDASNYVMLELGQPTHPYDLDRLPGRGFVVRAARSGEVVETLDGVARRLGDGPHPDCLICDAEDTPVGIAGIMGGASSEISGETRAVVLEAAYFDRMAIARTSKRIGLRSEASARFERGCDPQGIERAVARIVALLPGTATGSPADVSSSDHVPSPRTVRLRTARVNTLLGTALRDEDVRGYLEPIGFEVQHAAAGLQDVIVPTFRPDAEGEVDLIEEVARHHGYSRIGRTVPTSPRVGGLTPYQRERRLVRDVLAGLGVSEAVGPMLVGPGDHAAAGLPEGPGDVIEADDPLAREESVMRTSLLPGLLRAVVGNAAHRNPGVWLFEVGHVYRPAPPGHALPDEHERLAVALAGEDATAAVRALHVLGDALRLADVTLEAQERPGLHPTRSAAVVLDGTEAGVVGEVDPAVLGAAGYEGRVAWLDVDLGALLGATRRDPAMAPVTRFPSADIDLAFLVPDAVPAGAVEATLREAAGELLEWVRLFDVFRGRQAGEGTRSLAFRLRFRAFDRTLTDEELAGLRRRAIDAVAATHRAELRA